MAVSSLGAAVVRGILVEVLLINGLKCGPVGLYSVDL